MNIQQESPSEEVKQLATSYFLTLNHLYYSINLPSSPSSTLLNQNADLQYYHDLVSVMLLSYRGQDAVVKLLMKLPEGSTSCTCEIVKANLLKFFEQMLSLEGPRPSRDKNVRLGVISGMGHWEVVELLLKQPGVNPAANDCDAFRRAAKNGHWEVVKLLLEHPKVNPPAEEVFEALQWTVKGRHCEVVKVLLADPRLVVDVFTFHHCLELAIAADYREVVELFLKDHRASPTMIDYYTATAMINNYVTNTEGSLPEYNFYSSLRSPVGRYPSFMLGTKDQASQARDINVSHDNQDEKRWENR